MPGQRLARVSSTWIFVPIKRHTRRVTQFLACRFATRVFCIRSLLFRIIRRTGALDFIPELSEGYDTVVGERGVGVPR